MLSDYKTYDDHQLLALLAVDDGDAFTELYNRYWQPLFYKAGHKVSDLARAESIVQDIFMDLWRRRKELEITGDLSHYLSAALKYQVIKFQARLKKEAAHEQYLRHVSAEEAAADQQYNFQELRNRIEALVEKLPEKCRLAFRLREAGYSQKEISTRMDISENTVETHIARALKSLRAGLANFFSL